MTALLGEAVEAKDCSGGIMLHIQGLGMDARRKECIDALRWARRYHQSLRSVRGLARRVATWDDVNRVRQELTPYRGRGTVLDVHGPGGTRVAGFTDLDTIVAHMLTVAHAEGQVRKTVDEGQIALIIVPDVTPFRKASATRCDVILDIWADAGAHHHPENWATWWIYDGGDDAAHFCRMDTLGQLTTQV